MKHVVISSALAVMSLFMSSEQAFSSGQVQTVSASRLPEMHNGVVDGPFLRLLGRVEGPEGYTTITRATRMRPPAPLTNMTIAEVMDFQKKIRASGAKSSAMGRYQFIYKTLRHYVDSEEIDPSLPFDRYTQDTLARLEMRRCGFYDHVVSDIRVANCLAAVWAALPLVSGPKAGKSKYQGLAGNKALVSRNEVLATMRLRFEPIRVARSR